ncbi:MAG: acyl-CoA dehydrogenase [Chloroflexi bacterium]|nr:acyl-CoA dehydrogenase [Chloroflexota bacterium]
MSSISEEARSQIINLVREFVRKDVEPVASRYDHDDIYPAELIDTMREMGLFGITIPEKYGGLGLDHVTLAIIFEELSKGWMSVCGPIGTHLLMSAIITEHGTEDQKQRILPGMATGEIRGGLGLTEPEAGSDVQGIQTTATRDGEEYVLNGRKMFITNAENGNAYAVLTKTEPNADPAHRGMSCFIVQKPNPGLSVGQHIDKLGYRGVDTGELIFDDCRVGEEDLIGGQEGRGFHQVMDGLESGRINVAARAVGVATAAFEAAISYAQRREAFGVPIAKHQAIQLKLAEMGTKIEAARLLTMSAAQKKDDGERVDLAAGMAKLYASEICGEVAMDAMRIHGGGGYTKDFPVERYYRDAPLMIIGEGTNEVQKLVIARRLLERYRE